MSWVSIILLLLKIAESLMTQARKRGEMTQAQDALLSRSLRSSIDALQSADKARHDAERAFDESGGVPDESDPNLRD